jgi:hypothetical protein
LTRDTGQLDHLRQVGIRGFIAEHTNDDDYAYASSPARHLDETAPGGTANNTARGGTKKKATSTGTGKDRARKRANKK